MEANLKLKTLKLNDVDDDITKKAVDYSSSSDDEENEDENNNEKETSVDVGLIDDEEIDSLKPEDRQLLAMRLSSPFFPSKVGGKPAWLDYTNVPRATADSSSSSSSSKSQMHLTCETCKSQLTFLLQLYAPISQTDKFYAELESSSACFHRSLFVFVCTNTACMRKTTRIVRSQLARQNNVYAYDAPPQEDAYDSGEKFVWFFFFSLSFKQKKFYFKFLKTKPKK